MPNYMRQNTTIKKWFVLGAENRSFGQERSRLGIIVTQVALIGLIWLDRFVQKDALVLMEDLSSLAGRLRLNASKFGESFPMVTPSQA